LTAVLPKCPAMLRVPAVRLILLLEILDRRGNYIFFPIFQLAKAINLVIDDQIVDPFAWTSIEFPDFFVKLYMSGPRFATF
jgi:hypothetical protein